MLISSYYNISTLIHIINSKIKKCRINCLGEGWGRPHVEAMSMGLPIIATNWSGPTEFMTTENSYLLQYDGLEFVGQGAFRTHQWAKPSVDHLRYLMRELVTNYKEAKLRGVMARKDMISKYAPHVVGEIVLNELQRVVRTLHAKIKET